MKSSDIGKLNNHVKGILCIIAAAAGFSLMTFFVRISGDIPTMQKVFFRNAVALIIAVTTLIVKKEKLYRLPTYKMTREEVKTEIFRYVFWVPLIPCQLE